MKSPNRLLIKIMTRINKLKTGPQLEPIPSAHPCNSSMPVSARESLWIIYCLFIKGFHNKSRSHYLHKLCWLKVNCRPCVCVLHSVCCIQDNIMLFSKTTQSRPCSLYKINNTLISAIAKFIDMAIIAISFLVNEHRSEISKDNNENRLPF